MVSSPTLQLWALLFLFTVGHAARGAVLWAPWLNTKWLGNLYDYRSGLFSDVMYSNNRPFREGALLFQQQTALEQIALLYQRYNRFDETSYAAEDATFFNVQAASALRLGRYSLPIDQEVVLSVQRPLAPGEVRRYLNTPNVIKWAANAIMQQKRMKRHRFLNMDLGDGSFFKTAVVDIEYSDDVWAAGSGVLAAESAAAIASECRESLAQMWRPAEEVVGVMAPFCGGIKIPMRIANSANFLETLVQCILASVPGGIGDVSMIDPDEGGYNLLIGGYRDTPMNQLACHILERQLVASLGVAHGVTLLDFQECDVRLVSGLRACGAMSAAK